MGTHHDKRFPGEGDAYRDARDALLAADKGLRLKTEEVAALRRTLPAGGAPKEDYAFTDCATDGAVKLSELFEDGKISPAIYSFMYAPGDEAPCPMCVSLLDGLDGQAPHITDRMNFAVAADRILHEHIHHRPLVAAFVLGEIVHIVGIAPRREEAQIAPAARSR